MQEPTIWPDRHIDQSDLRTNMRVRNHIGPDLFKLELCQKARYSSVALAVTKLGAGSSIPTLAELETFLSKS